MQPCRCVLKMRPGLTRVPGGGVDQDSSVSVITNTLAAALKTTLSNLFLVIVLFSETFGCFRY